MAHSFKNLYNNLNYYYNYFYTYMIYGLYYGVVPGVIIYGKSEDLEMSRFNFLNRTK